MGTVLFKLFSYILFNIFLASSGVTSNVFPFLDKLKVIKVNPLKQTKSCEPLG